MPKIRSLGWVLCLQLALAAALCAQTPAPSPEETSALQLSQSPPASQQRVTVRGQICDARTGAGIERALVRIEGNASTGTLSGPDGGFEIKDVPVGPQSLNVVKPGFRDLSYGGFLPEDASVAEEPNSLFATGNHNIVVAPEMPSLRFLLLPTAALEGRVLFPTGEPAPKITIQLAGRVVEDGRRIWQSLGEGKTRADGSFRFAGLSAGEYTLFINPFLEKDSDVNAEEANGDAGDVPAESEGYTALYFPNARTPEGLAPIRLAPGEQRQTTLTLNEESFHRVTIPLASKPGELSSMVVRGSVTDAGGHALGYPVRYSAAQHTLEALLPEGSYRLEATTAPQQSEGTRQRRNPDDFRAATIELAIAGKPLRSTEFRLDSQSPSAIEIAGAAAHATDSSTLVVLSYPATGWIDDGMAADFAIGKFSAPLVTRSTAPGSYWLAPQLDRKDLCEAAFTANGTSLANEPVQVGAGGSTPPLALALRSDCARLRLTLPASIIAFAAGEEPFFTAYAVPDFEFTHSLRALTLRPTSGASMTLEGLTPGSYHVYLLAGTHQLAYRDRAALAKLKGQPVELAPGASAELLLEAPAE